MHEPNVQKILSLVGKNAKVLDLGGWAKPFNRANYVLDLYPYRTRGFFGSQGDCDEKFTKDTWIQRDLSLKNPLPFKDKEFDFVICSHTLEDIRDPVWLCSEMQRIGKAGYIEVPSIKSELTLGIADKKYAGFYHHRWLVDIIGNRILFLFKPHCIHSRWDLHFPVSYLRELDCENKIKFLFWKNNFKFCEIIQISRDKTEQRIREIVKKEKVYPLFFYKLSDMYCCIEKKFFEIKKYFFPKSYYHRFMDTPEYYSK